MTRRTDHLRAVPGAAAAGAAAAAFVRAMARVPSAAVLLSSCLAASAVAAPAHAAVIWARPVAGEALRPFALRGSPYAAGQHRGVDLAARSGAAVGAPCTGRIAVAGRIGSSGGVVTVACGPWRASVLPLARIEARRGEHVTAGAPVGTASASARHAGVHLGVRRAGERFGYVDPLRFLPSPHGPPVAPSARRVREEPRLGPPSALAAMGTTPPPAAPARLPGVHASGARLPVDVAAWPAWAGAALLLAAAGGGVRRRRRRERATASAAVARLSGDAG